MGPVIDELSNVNEGKAKVAKVDVNQNMPLAAKYGVSMLPTILVFKNGEVVETQVGLVPGPKLQEMIDAHVSA
ncbi:MAG: thioredoxin domain-containing protein [Pirellulaceae bacterium]|nr:thioredoxin domain-containing protein [Pirellulaceae bacterium]